jgi:hypothetical protein
MGLASEISSSWNDHLDWGRSTRLFEEKIGEYCRDVIPEQHLRDAMDIVQKLVRTLLEEPIQAIEVLLETQKAQLQLIIRSLDDGRWDFGYHLEPGTSSDHDQVSYDLRSLPESFPITFLQVLRNFLELAGKSDSFGGSTSVSPLAKRLKI